MKKIPNSVVSDLIRLLPVLIDNLPQSNSTRLVNATRRVGIIIKKLKKLETINAKEDQDGKD